MDHRYAGASFHAGRAVRFELLASHMMLEKHFNTTDLPQTLGLPIRMNSCCSIKPLYAQPAAIRPHRRRRIRRHLDHQRIDRGAGSARLWPSRSWPVLLARCPWHLSVGWPRGLDRRRRGTILRSCGWAISGSGRRSCAAWKRCCWNRAHAPALRPEALLRGLADYILQTMEILFERFQFDGVAISDDYGTQRGMLMSPAGWRRLSKPILAEIYAYAQQRGRTVFHHSCGNICPIIGDLIEIGLDILHPIQPEAMDACELKREFGRQAHLLRRARHAGPPAARHAPGGAQEVKPLKERMAPGAATSSSRASRSRPTSRWSTWSP